MKKQFQFLFIFTAMILCCGNVAGDSNQYYANIQVTSQGGGKVYVNHGSGAPSYTTTANYGPTYLTGNKNIDFYMYASPDAGYKFDRWEAADKITSINAQTGTNDKVTVYSSQTDKSKAPTGYVKAYFVEDVVKYQMKIQRPDEGSISIKSSYSKDSVATLYSTDAKSESSLYVLEADTVTLMAQNGNSDKTFTAWYKVENGNKILLSYANPYKGFFTANTTIYAEYNNNNFLVGGNQYKTLSDAKGAINDINKTIILLKDYIISENTEIPTGVTLLIPNNENHVVYTTEPGAHHSYKAIDGVQTDFKIDRSFVYRKLSINPGYTLTINGSVSIGAWRWCPTDLGSFGAKIPNTTGSFRVDQGYGLIDMGAESSIVLKSGSNLYCWGRIRGNGTVIAESGATVYESWVYTDMRDNNAYECIYNDTKCFPMNQYYIQDIQVPITFHNGSSEILATGMYVDKGVYPYIGKITWIGSSKSFFKLLNDSSSVTKKYDVASDRLIYDLMGDVDIDYAQLSISASISTETFSTNEALFDLTNNNTINIFGNTTIKYDLALAAGAELNIEKDANVTLAYRASLYAFDSEDWGDFACKKKIVPLFLPQYELSENCANFYSNNGITPDTYVGYTSYKAIRTEDNIADAKIKINGTLIIKGGNNSLFNEKNYKSGLYSTNHGAQIYSSLGGNIVYEEGAGTQDTVSQLWEAGKGDSKNCVTVQQKWVSITPAQLMQGNGSYYPTAAYTTATTFKYFGTGENGKWGKVSTVTFKDGESTLSTTDYAEGETISAPTPEKDGYKFLGWDKEVSVMGAANITYNAVWEKQIESLDITTEQVITDGDTEHPTDLTDNDNTYIVEENLGVQTVIVEDGAKVDVTEVASLNVAQTLILNASENSSGDLVGVGENVTVADDANVYFDYDFNTPAIRWNAIAFPWQIDATSGVKVGDQTLTLGTDFDVIYYDGQKRSEEGPVQDCWRYVEDDIAAGNIDDAEILVPGKLYMILFAKAQNVVRFAKIANAQLNNTDVNVVEYGTGGNDANWNGIANPTMYHAYLDAGVEDGQTYNNADRSYEPITFAEENLPVGKPVFVQAANAQSVVVSKDAPNSAPFRLAANRPIVRAEVEIKANDVATDKVIIRTDEDAADEYTIGSDLSKAGVSTTVAQMWINRYNAKLCKNTIAPVEDVAEYPLTIFAPANGNYTLALRKTLDADVTLYLTQDDGAIANLTENDYTLNLTKGNSKGLGLRLVVKTQPGVVTSLDEALTTKKALNKVIYRGNLYIIRDGKVFNAQGARL